MKTIYLVAWLCIALLSTKSSFAESSDSLTANNIPDHLKKQFSTCVCFPKQAFDNGIEGLVTTCFHVTEAGTIQINCINGHPVLTGYVRQKLEGIKCCDFEAEMINKPLYISFNFRIE